MPVDRAATRMLAGLFPLTCPGCGCRADPVCAACASRLRSAPIGVPPPGVDSWAAPFAYEGVARELVARVKYRGAHAATSWLANAMAVLVTAPLPDVVTWVPTTSARRRQRGFDHAELLACRVARRIHRPACRLLTRADGPPQTGMMASDRRRGPVISPRRSAPARVLLVDDVATTGGSLARAAAALRVAGADQVVALTAARTPGPDGRPTGRRGPTRP
jgi:predicted amidophosphoribosyltransferase